MKAIDRPELGKLTMYSPTMLRVIESDLEQEYESLDRQSTQFQPVSVEIKCQIKLVRAEIFRRRRKRLKSRHGVLVLPTWAFYGALPWAVVS